MRIRVAAVTPLEMVQADHEVAVAGVVAEDEDRVLLGRHIDGGNAGLEIEFPVAAVGVSRVVPDDLGVIGEG